MEKVSLREVTLELGRKCNLKCKHCMKGKSQDVAMSDEVMDALLDNVYFIDEFNFGGGEPLLYVERMETLLRKCKEKGVKVNYITVVSNCTIKSEEFVRVFNEWGEYTTFRNNRLLVSNDIFHEEYVKEHLPSVNLEENIKWYEERLKYCGVEKADNMSLNLKIRILDEGNVNSWTQEEKDEFLRVDKISIEKNKSLLTPIKPICQGKENACGYGCVKNCVSSTIVVNVYGKIYLHDGMPFEDQDNPENEMVMGNILEKDIYTIIKEWNESLNETKNELALEIEKDDFWEGISKRMSERLLEADQFCKKGEFGKTEEILDEIEKYNDVILAERQKTLDSVKNILEAELKNWEHPFDYLKYLEENDPHMFEQFGLLEKLDNPSIFQNIIEELKKCKDVLEERKKLDMPGSIFEKPIRKPVRNDFTGIIDFATRIKCMWEFAKLFKNIKMD